jgi:hypothetical protein
MNKKPDIELSKDKLSAIAENIAAEFNISLDYSLESIRKVEFVLGKVNEYYKKLPSKEGMVGVALGFGAYIVKVIERHFGPVKWRRDDPISGLKETFPLAWQGDQIYPVGWCLKRILNGPEDDVWCKFRAIVMNHKKFKQAMLG